MTMPDDTLAAARGMFNGVILGLAMWAVIFAACL